MVEEAWLDKGDVILPEEAHKYFLELIEFYEWMQNNHMDIINEYKLKPKGR